MTGAVMALAGGNGSLGGSGVVISPAPAWTAIYDYDIGSNNLQTIAGITTPVSISLSISGGGGLYYTKNAAFTYYTGAFSVSAGDTLAFSIVSSGRLTKTGNLTVTNVSNASATVATIPYTVIGSGGS